MMAGFKSEWTAGIVGIRIPGQIVAEAMVELGTADDEGVAKTTCGLMIND